MLRFFIQRILIFSLPFILLLAVYLIKDPFKVLYNYDNYYEESVIGINRDFVSSEMYLKNSEKYQYDSFIFGSSNALSFPPSLWRKYISTHSSPFSFDASIESISGIHSKIKFIHNNGCRIKNALLVFDTGVTFRDFKNSGHIIMKHYSIYKSSWLKYHYESFTSFIDIKFLFSLMHYKISNRFYPYMVGILDDKVKYYDEITNEEYFYGPQNELKADSLNYYQKREDIFRQICKVPENMTSQISEEYRIMLEDIKEIFDVDSTSFRIVITPLLNKITFNNNDLKLLIEIFGESNVFDFSGINEYTLDISNYYDDTHFKRYVGDEILKEI